MKPDEPNVYFAEFQGSGNLFRSADRGLSFQRVTGIPSSDRTSFLPPFVFDPAYPDRMLYATHRIYESTDGGRRFSAISGDLTGGSPAAVRSLVIAPSRPRFAYASTNDGLVLASKDGGSRWRVIRRGVAGWPRVMRQLAVDPGRPYFLAVADSEFGGERLVVTENRGKFWKVIGQGLPDVPVNTVAVRRVGGKRFILAGTDAGVWVTSDDGASWQEHGSGLPRAPVMDLVVDLDHRRLVASTLGRGMWTTALPR